MSTLLGSEIATLLEPFFPAPPPLLIGQLSTYLDLLVKWNARMNLSAIREPTEIVRRHFGESLFLARHLPPCKTLLDLGSGAGFPGLPVQLAHPHVEVTLSESQNKKASFLREVLRVLELPTQVWAGRVEDLPGEARFDVVTLRAVDNPMRALELAHRKIVPGGLIFHLGRLSTDGVGVPVPDAANSYLNIIR